jgi:hypothetical protein
VFSGKEVVEHASGLGSCDFYPEKVAANLQRIEISVAGYESSVAGYQKGGITSDCLDGLKSDAERERFFIENTNWYSPV